MFIRTCQFRPHFPNEVQSAHKDEEGRSMETVVDNAPATPA